MRTKWLAGLAVLALLAGCGLFRSGPEPAEGFTVSDGLEWTLWAAEPDLVNPTNIAVDERGRVWITEAVNYRRRLRDEPDLVAEGDRIVILEDTDGDGRADARKVFDQQPELRSPLGIAVLGNKVYVSQSPDVIVYTKDEEDNIVSREMFLTGFGGFDHDHGVHAVVFGPDGRLYLNAGDQGFNVTGRGGRRIVSSKEGPYYAGAVLRLEPDGEGLEAYAHNFRNPYELAIDSWGTIWQTDNDDDGNQWTRLLYVMEGGNFGYWGPGGRRWREDHGTHFHHELPGVTPNIARTGPGSPSGLVVYEGRLLPEPYQGALLHAEPGKRRVYAFFLEPDGAGYQMEEERVVSSDDSRFRPVDIAVAPDGAVFAADWYDPVVGGHNMLDHEKGRIYRLAPPRHEASQPRLDLETADGRRAALGSPNSATFYLGWSDYRTRGDEALGELRELWQGDDPLLRSRALWLIGLLAGPEAKELDEALESEAPRERILGLRAARRAGRDPADMAPSCSDDPNAQVRRECALMLAGVEGQAAVEALLRLAEGYDGEDRWHLEAWAIGARGKEQPLAARLLEQARLVGWDPKLADLFWELEAPGALPYLSKAVGDPVLSLEDRSRALRAIADRSDAASTRFTARLAADRRAPDELRRQAFSKLARQLFSDWQQRRADPAVVAAVRAAFQSEALRGEALQLAADLEDSRYAPQIAALARDETLPDEVRAQAVEAVGQAGGPNALALLERFTAEGPPAVRAAAVRGIAATGPPDLDERMMKLLLAEGPNEVRSAALRTLARNEAGLNQILDLAEKGDLPAEVKTLATNLVSRSRFEAVRERAAAVLPPPEDKLQQQLPRNPREILEREGDAARGREVFFAKEGPKCANCHSLDPAKELAGPTLMAIGAKYDKGGLLDSILNPSAGIAPEYCVWILNTSSHGLVIGVLAEDTPERVIVRNEFGEELTLPAEEVLSRRKSDLSMMPEDLVNTMTVDELADLLEFLTTLRGGDAPQRTGA